MSTQAKPLADSQRAVWTDAYRAYERWHEHPGGPDDWKDCAIALHGLVVQHGETPLARRLFAAVYDALSEEQVEREASQADAPMQIEMEGVRY